MCGIAGVFHCDGAPADRGCVVRMADAIAHRGPDDSGVLIDGNVGLANRRLAILDLSDAGHQPMSTADGRYCITYNGELYNYLELRDELIAAGHRFRSGTDTEVILEAWRRWGAASLEHFDGMFAFALWDSEEQRLSLVRDRLGIKPLYWVETGGAIAFASEIKVLLEVPGFRARARPEAIAQYLAFTHPVDDETWFDGVHRLAPGGCLEVRREGVTSRSWWDPLELYREPQRRGDTAATAAEIRALLEDAIRKQQRSDVPMGAHLSGGIDSSAVVALLSAQREEPVSTFSGAFDTGPRYDERAWVAKVVARYHTDHHEVVPGAGALGEQLPALTWHMDEPTAGPGAFAQLNVCRLVRESGITVVLGGQGGDEIFGGYPRYAAHAGHGAGLRVSGLRTGLRRGLLGGSLGFRTAGLSRELAGALRGYRATRPILIPEDRAADEMYFDLRHYLPALLHVEDRTSMSVSVESRVPLLSHHLVEFMASVPTDEKLAGPLLKPLLREAVRDIVPAAILARTDKRGFPTPVGPWIRGPLFDYTSRTLLSPEFTERRVFSRNYLRGLLQAHRRGVPGLTHHLWSALSTALWFQVFDAEVTW